jgi:hypothetical protein
MLRFTHVMIGLFCFFNALLQAQDGYFNPETDPILSTINGKVRFVQSEEVIARAADIRIGKLNTVETFDKVQIQGNWYFTLECRFAPDPDQSARVYLKLRPDDKGNFFADSAWIACVGVPCGSCDWNYDTYDCYCKTDRPGEPGVLGECTQVWSTDPLLKKVKLRPD